MSDDYQLPDGFVNPVPDPDEKKPKPWAGWSLPDSGPISGEEILKGLGVAVAIAFIFSDAILDIAEAPVRDAIDAVKDWLESQ